MGNDARSQDEFLDEVRKALVLTSGPDQTVRWEALVSDSSDAGRLPSQIARDLGVPEVHVLNGVLALLASGAITIGQSGLSCEERELRIQLQNDKNVVRFALLPHLKPIIFPGEGGLFSVVLLALEYLNADRASGNYRKLADGSFPHVQWRVGYVVLSPHEFRNLSALSDGNPESLYGYDFAMWARNTLCDCEIIIKSLPPAWKRHTVAGKVEEAAVRLAQNGGAKLLEALGGQAALEDWGAIAAGCSGKSTADMDAGAAPDPLA